jgi:hypothetical protein
MTVDDIMTWIAAAGLVRMPAYTMWATKAPVMAAKVNTCHRPYDFSLEVTLSTVDCVCPISLG